ncbi:antibiotic biosynthesis monooxygenase [Candidatus Bathyarchaeota archaeon]|nr:MAG: antibiotic biosynthesis monooxygenase [Candidatus Bathyarchaeota archaeon]
MVVVVSNRIPVKKGHEEEFEHRWKNRKWSIANSPGFIRTEVLRPVKGENYIVVTHWQSMKEFEDWTNSDAFTESHSNAPPREAFSGPSQLEIYEVIAER